jgi:hypothetical protein
VSVPFWSIPALLTAAIWFAAICWPKGKAGGSYDFGPTLLAVLHLYLAVIGTMFVWLVFFLLAASGVFA